MIFKAKEKSDCLARNCLSGDCRPFKCKVESQPSDVLFLNLEREFTCTCLCLSRPVMEIKNNSDYVGKVLFPFNCCSKRIEIFDNKHTLKYAIEGSICQLGFCLPLPCEPCQIVDFNILGKFSYVLYILGILSN